jgi:D-alanine-D-alanine ligase
MSRHVAVLMGGWSPEREVSLVSGQACVAALREVGYTVSEIDVDRHVAKTLIELGPDVVFNALHGTGGEDGRIQGLLDVIGLPYTHSGVLASALAMNKPMAKRVFRSVGLRCTGGLTAHRDQVLKGDVLPRPYVIKPIDQGSSVGVHIAHKGENRAPLQVEDWGFGEWVLVEPYVPGRELTVAVMGDEALAVTELQPHQGFYDYDAKYKEGRTVHHCPADLPADIYAETLRMALDAHRALGCRGVSRADFRYDDSHGTDPERLFLLEVNTQPGMTPLSLVPEQAAHRGISFPELVRWMVEHATCDS